MDEERIKEIYRLKEQYPLSFKRWLAREVESGKISRKEAKVRYCLNSESTIWTWVQQYGKAGQAVSGIAKTWYAKSRISTSPVNPYQHYRER